MFGRFDDLEINVRTCTTRAQIGSTKVCATWAMLSGDKDENQMCPLIQELVQDILDKVHEGQTLEAAICSMDTGFGSTVLELQQYVAADDGAGWCLPDTWDKISQAEYDELVKNHKEKIEVYVRKKVNGITDGFKIYYTLRYGHEPGRSHEICYTGSCEVRDSRLGRIYRRQNRKGFLSRLFAS